MLYHQRTGQGVIGKGTVNPADVLLTLLTIWDSTQLHRVYDTHRRYPIATANDIFKSARLFMSRFAVIDIPDYTPEEKKIIFSKHAMPKGIQ